MCIQSRNDVLDFVATAREVDQERKEFLVSRESRWFQVRFYNRRTLSGDRTRYVFVDESRYGIVWPNVIFFVLGHLVFFFAMYALFRYRILGAWLYGFGFGVITSIGITAGAHRLWSHKSYKASVSLRILLAALFTATGQNDIWTWCRDHRLHHKYTETDADPHNSRRGAFFAHVGWLLTKKHPDIFLKGKTIDNSDLMNDPVVYYNKKFYVIWYILLRVYLPTLVPMLWYGQEFRLCVLGTFTQYILNLHATWFVNSAAHIFGDRPYNNKIQPRENFFVAVFGLNEGFHNYHHQFPWDYAIAEFGIKYWDPAKWLINLAAKYGFAYDLKKASPELIENTRKKYAPELIMEEPETPIREPEPSPKDDVTTDELTVKGKKAIFNEYNFYVHDHPYFTPHQFCAEGTEDSPFYGA